jgi:hypothetical protein
MTNQISQSDLMTRRGGRAPARKRPLWLYSIAAVAVLAMLQSVTITPPIESRVVQDETGVPVEGLHIVAVYLANYATVGGAIPGMTLRVETAETDKDGRFRLPAAVMIHRPVAPFSFFYRSDTGMPMLVGCKPGVGVMGAGSNKDSFPGFLSFRRTGLNDVDLKMRLMDRDNYDIQMASAASAISDAADECRKHSSCRIEKVHAALESCRRGSSL